MPEELDKRQTPSKKALGDILSSLWKTAAGVVPLAVAAIVFFPFQWLTSIPSALLLIGAAVCAFRALDQASYKMMIVGCLTGIVGLVWATLGVFFFGSGTLYCFYGDTLKPLSSVLEPLAKHSSSPRLFYIADPIRASPVVSKVVEKLLPNRVLFLRVLTDGSQQYIKLPLTTAVRHTINGVSANSGIRQLFVSYFGPNLSVYYGTDDVTGSAAGKPTFRISSGAGYGRPVSFTTHPGSAHALPWEAVAYSGSPSVQQAKYAAEADAAIHAASLGDFEEAFDGLDAAYVIAPSGIERARCVAIASELAFDVINGSVGETQSIGSMLQALREWRSVRTDAEIQAQRFGSEVEIWLFRTFQNFGESHPAYPDIRKLFGTVPQLHPGIIKKKMGSTTVFSHVVREDSLETTLETGELSDLRRIATESQAGCTPLRQKIADRFGPDSLRWAWENLMAPEDAAEPLPDAAIECINQVIPEPIRTRNTKYKAVTDDMRSFVQSQRDRPDTDWFERLERLSRSAGFIRLSKQYQALAANNVGSPPSAFNPSLADWWNPNWLDSFAADAFIALTTVNDVCDKSTAAGKKECADLISSTADKYERDANKRVFLPAVSFTIALAKTVGEPVNRNWIGAYQDTLQGDPLHLLKK